MARRSRIYYSDSQKALMWERWKAAETLHQIAHFFDRSHSSVHRTLAETGGIRPPCRRRSRLALTLVEREEISRCLDQSQRWSGQLSGHPGGCRGLAACAPNKAVQAR